jgi:hypothetical protein
MDGPECAQVLGKAKQVEVARFVPVRDYQGTVASLDPDGELIPTR